MRKQSTGVYFQKKSKRFIAKPWIAKRAYYIGSFRTEEEAELAVKEFKEKNSYLANYDPDMDSGDPYLELNRIADTRKLPLSEIKIRCAIVQQSLDDIRYGSISQRMMAAHWMMSEDLTYPFSFISIADIIGMDGIRIRNQIFKAFNIKESEVNKYVKELSQSTNGRAPGGQGVFLHGADESGDCGDSAVSLIKQTA